MIFYHYFFNFLNSEASEDISSKYLMEQPLQFFHKSFGNYAGFFQMFSRRAYNFGVTA